MTGKVCNKCKTNKPITDFYEKNARCKDCVRKQSLAYRHNNIDKVREYDRKRNKYSVSRLLNNHYANMKQRVLGKTERVYRVRGMELMSRFEWELWVNANQAAFQAIYNKWVQSGFKRRYAPSIDRIDNTRGYATDNLQWLTLSANSKKYDTKVKQYAASH